MMNHLLSIGTLLSALGAGLIGGVFFAFSTFVMRALGRLPVPQGVAAMQAINLTVINPLFLGTFLGTAVLGVILAGVSLPRWRSEPAATVCVLVGSFVYLVGVVLVTMRCSVPRNDALAAVVDPHGAEGARLWDRYLREWTAWNHVRTVSGLLAAAAFTLAFRFGPSVWETHG